MLRSDPVHATHTPTTRHRHDRVQYLLVADETTLADLEAALALLPLCARGRVFVEVPTPEDISHLTVPPRMTVTWLPRSARRGAPGTAARCARGEAASRAVRGWAAEMFCDGPDETNIWLSGAYDAVAGLHELFVDEVHMDQDRVTTPPEYRLAEHRRH